METLIAVISCTAIVFPVAPQPVPFIYMRSFVASWALPWAQSMVEAGYIPEKIGRYIVVDMLIYWADGSGR